MHRSLPPAQPLIGREHTAADLAQRVRTTRFLTLTGPGGVGKTSLAVLVAHTVAAAFPDGVVWGDLSALRAAALVPSAIAEALGMAAARADQLPAQIAAALQGRRMLLVFDNCEQVLDAASFVAELLAATPSIHVLATSRAAWRIAGEQEYPLAPLALPAGDDPESIGAAPAVQLLLERARPARRDLMLTPADAADLSAICRHLDGLPLAIELAAARLRVLAPHDLQVRLARSLPILTGGSRDAPDRQRTLRNTIAWSYDLLSVRAQAHLRQLAVFVGGADSAALRAVWTPVGGDAELYDALTVLVEHSLVISVADQTAERYRLFATVREFALEQLEAHGEAPAARLRHARYYLALAEAAEPHLTGPGQAEWIARLALEQGNLLSALDWFLDGEHGDVEQALRLGTALARFWWITNRLIEGRTALERILAALSRAAQTATAHHAALLQWAATMAWGQADYAAAQRQYTEALDRYRALHDQTGTARALKGLGTLAREQGRTQEARRLFEEALALMRAADDTWGLTLVLSHLGMTLETLGRYAEAYAIQTECLTLSRELDDNWSVAYALKDCAYLHLQLGIAAEARRQVGEALAIFARLDDTQGLAYALLVLGDIALHEGALAEAEEHFSRMRGLLETIGDQRGVALARCGLGDVALARGAHEAAHSHLRACLAGQHEQRNPITLPRGLEAAARLAAAVSEPERAVQLFAAADGIRRTMEIPLPAAQSAPQAAVIGQVRRILGAERFAAAWSAGQALSDVEAIALAGRPLPPPQLTADAPRLVSQRSAPDHSALTAREREVLELLVRGLKNGAIAAALQMSPHTVHSHVRTIFSKLDVSNRAAATRVALEQGLVLKAEG